jgi:hypothetical protein
MRRVSDVKDYILRTYGEIPGNKFDIVKIGPSINIFLVTRDNELVREQIFKGALDTVETEPKLKEYLENNIKTVLSRYRYC